MIQCDYLIIKNTYNMSLLINQNLLQSNMGIYKCVIYYTLFKYIHE
jgi:hypothetical protein